MREEDKALLSKVLTCTTIIVGCTIIAYGLGYVTDNIPKEAGSVGFFVGGLVAFRHFIND